VRGGQAATSDQDVCTAHRLLGLIGRQSDVGRDGDGPEALQTQWNSQNVIESERERSEREREKLADVSSLVDTIVTEVMTDSPELGFGLQTKPQPSSRRVGNATTIVAPGLSAHLVTPPEGGGNARRKLPVVKTGQTGTLKTLRGDLLQPAIGDRGDRGERSDPGGGIADTAPGSNKASARATGGEGKQDVAASGESGLGESARPAGSNVADSEPTSVPRPLHVDSEHPQVESRSNSRSSSRPASRAKPFRPKSRDATGLSRRPKSRELAALARGGTAGAGGTGGMAATKDGVEVFVPRGPAMDSRIERTAKRLMATGLRLTASMPVMKGGALEGLSLQFQYAVEATPNVHHMVPPVAAKGAGDVIGLALPDRKANVDAA